MKLIHLSPDHLLQKQQHPDVLCKHSCDKDWWQFFNFYPHLTLSWFMCPEATHLRICCSRSKHTKVPTKFSSIWHQLLVQILLSTVSVTKPLRQTCRQINVCACAQKATFCSNTNKRKWDYKVCRLRSGMCQNVNMCWTFYNNTCHLQFLTFLRNWKIYPH
jgi:hypothetical protein